MIKVRWIYHVPRNLPGGFILGTNDPNMTNLIGGSKSTGVFKVLWSEPKGATGTEITMRANGEDAHQKIRRFVVVINCPGHSLCIPILTYGGQGTTKRGVHAADHAIIYTSKKDGPQLMQNEVLYKEPIRMEPIDDSHKLDEASRVNYRKVYTVEHNVKVMFIGDLTKTARAQVIADYNLVHPLLTNSDPETDYTTDRELPGPQQTNHSSTAPSAEQGGMGTQTGPGDSTPRAETHSYTSFGNPQNVLVTSYSNPATSSFQPIVSTYQQPQSDEPPGSAEDYYSPEG
ncbi:hypothetical protein BKA64DRAFT_701582 [Cadophora sp. MPI-SDFR-AT-0126]|nr:hypothetical protein BKA64DRAFT_701582 [Leotiomycetes sp. MPI-SDFR-AT-0126]